MYKLLLPFIVLLFFSENMFSSTIDSLQTLLLTSSDEKLKMEIYFNLGKEYQQIDIDSAILYFSEAEHIAKQEKIESEQANIVKNIGNCYHMIGDMDNALVYYVSAQGICLKLDSINSNDTINKKLLAGLYHNIALIKNFKGENRVAINLHLKEEQIRNSINDVEGNGIYTYPSIGSAYMEQGEYSRASDYFYKALKIWEKLKNDKEIASVYDMLGVINEKQDNYHAALENYQKSLEIRNRIGDDYYISFSYNNIGVAYFHLNNYDKALEFYQKSLAMKEKFNDKISIRNTLSNISLIYQFKKEYEKSFEYALKTIEISEEFEDLYETTKAQLNAGTSAGYMNDYKTAEKYLSQAFETAKKNNYLDLLKDVTGNFSIMYKNIGKYDKAFDMLLMHKEISDSLFNADLIKKLTANELNYEFDKKLTADSIKVAKQNFEHNEKLKRQKLVSYSLVFGIILILILAYVVFRSFKISQKSKQNELEKKAAEIEKSLLRTQMNPHFIFNSMNSIQSFISKNNTYEAEKYLSKFAQLIRFILENSAQSYITFEDEINSLKLYLELEQLRFNHKFDFEFKIDETIDDEFIKIPPMLIQPYVENAILHGIMHKESKGNITLDFAIDEQENIILCSVTDNGIGRKKAAELKELHGSTHKSVGMRITNERLEFLNKENRANISVKIIDLENDSGTKVELHIPFIED